MQIVLRNASIQEWWTHAKADKRATFFQTPYWFSIWQKYAGYSIASLYFQFENGKCGVFPLATRSRHRGLSKEYLASPAGTYGGPVSSFALDEEERRALEYYVFNRKSFVYRLNPLASYSPTLDVSYKADYTHLVNLSELDENNLLRDWRKGHKADAKRAIREGVIIVSSNDPNDLPDYYAAYLDSRARWGNKASSFYRLHIFEELMRLPSESVKLWKAIYRDKMIYGCLCFYHNDHAVYWHGAGLSKFFGLGAVHALQWKIIDDALNKGMKYYDFNPSGGHEGVAHFKEGFAAVKASADILKGTGTADRIIYGLRPLLRWVKS